MEERSAPAIVRLAGEQDIATRHEVHLAFQKVRENPRVIVDLTRLTYVDSTAIDELYRAESRALALHGKLVIVARNQRMIRLLSIAGLTARTPIVDSLGAAAELMRRD
ncbi:MAG: STAS domain-containing protein [Candidatus Eremiobacteraeota bacterium]|nr:STAS domain-containing protein [Candidatus Eremiobacteraeota bacterium]